MLVVVCRRGTPLSVVILGDTGVLRLRIVDEGKHTTQPFLRLPGAEGFKEKIQIYSRTVCLNKDPIFIEGDTFTSIGRTLPRDPYHNPGIPLLFSKRKNGSKFGCDVIYRIHNSILQLLKEFLVLYQNVNVMYDSKHEKETHK